VEPEGSVGRWFGRIVSKVRHMIAGKVPEGYQDDFGFHFGRQNHAGHHR
jgi:hypothetical protein